MPASADGARRCRRRNTNDDDPGAPAFGRAPVER
jgi:hypothetical protein